MQTLIHYSTHTIEHQNKTNQKKLIAQLKKRDKLCRKVGSRQPNFE